MLFNLFTEENYVSSLRSIFHMERSIYKYIHAVHDMVTAMTKHHKDENNNDLLIMIKACIFPLLQNIADLEGILLRKSFYLVEHTSHHIQIAAIARISAEGFDGDISKTKALLYNVKKFFKQLYPNGNKIIDETIENILHLETRRKNIFVSINQWKNNNDPSKVRLVKKSK